MTKLQALKKTIRLAGSQAKLAKGMNIILKRKKKKSVSQPQICYWVNVKKEIPAEFAQEASEAVAYQVTHIQLRPDVYAGVQ